MDLKDKVIVVTGGLGSLGRAVSAAAVSAGAKVYAIDVVDGKPEAGVEATPALDLGDSEATKKAFSDIASKAGRIDALVNVAGGFAWETIDEGSIDTWDFLYKLNVRTAVNASKAVLAHMPKSGGRIVNISAAGSVKADLGLGAYAASKSGVSRLTEALAEELKSRNITVNAVQPSIIDTKPNRDAMPDADFATWVTPAALADVILFLISPQAEAITGALIPVVGRV
ncbi:NAD(P)-dependent dehydrogenase (short-subunit alcohol dehydrogenase family) [Litorivivens lipolytica]|uniref:NAD(P)-dependent dehydrogenase (Short-subunit alcohol dehydrogenase family) n=1 Tax=Litorivivens lipolytica TaxID=1524264 RepID=A0A7W4W4D7_9GAMM|nr:SDR family NAD(P)-dependent oxidoreductase [Litorivivens lipolytica]MBB3047199.1 NAD(P)-dependent dehydrogenase (short-subunit alcohol dehydrogenase family) [Litorivivens lipolytica]